MSFPDQDTRRKHPLEVVPPETVASPTQMVHEEDLPWWKPGLSDVATHLGWRWILAVPAVIVLVLLVASIFDMRFITPLWMMGFKFLVICMAIPIVLLA